MIRLTFHLLVHLSRRLTSTFVRWTSSIHPSVVNFVFTFSTSPLKSLNGSQRPLPSLCFRADLKNKMATPASDWLRHLRLPLWYRWTEFNETWQEVRFKRPLPQLSFSDRLEEDGCPASDWLIYFGLLLCKRWTEFSETWREARSQRLLSSLCFSGRSENQDGRRAPDLLRHFQLFLWNDWTEFNEIWQKYNKRRLLRCVRHFKSDLINNMDHISISGNELSWVILSQTKWFQKLKLISRMCFTRDGVINRQNCNFKQLWYGKFRFSKNATNKPKSTVDLCYMCSRGLSGPRAVTLTKYTWS